LNTEKGTDNVYSALDKLSFLGAPNNTSVFIITDPARTGNGAITTTIKARIRPDLLALADALNNAAAAVKAAPMEQPAPAMPNVTINLTAQMPEVGAPTVTVNVPEQAAPVVNVAPAAVTVNNEVQPAPVTVKTEKPKRVKVKRDASGVITGLESE
jgi:hypothetical protein